MCWGVGCLDTGSVAELTQPVYGQRPDDPRLAEELLGPEQVTGGALVGADASSWTQAVGRDGAATGAGQDHPTSPKPRCVPLSRRCEPAGPSPASTAGR